MVRSLNNYDWNNEDRRGYRSIDIYVGNSNELFKQFNFVSPVEKELREDIENYIYESMKGFPENKKVVLKIHVLNAMIKESTMLVETVQKHFLLKYKESERLAKRRFYHWCGNMTIGILFLIFCLMLVQLLDSFENISAVKIIKESLMIIGWVAIWEPTTFILFQWRGIKKSRSCYRKLCSMSVVIETK